MPNVYGKSGLPTLKSSPTISKNQDAVIADPGMMKVQISIDCELISISENINVREHGSICTYTDRLLLLLHRHVRDNSRSSIKEILEQSPAFFGCR